MKNLMMVILLGIAVSSAFGDIVQLKDGTIIRGKISKADSSAVALTDEKGIQQTIPRDKILNVTYEPVPQVGQPYSPTTPTTIIDRREIIEAANSLRSFRDQYYWGTILYFSGSIIMTLSNDPAVVLIGGIGFVVGAIIQLIAVNSVGTAGDHLDNAAR